MKLPCTTSLITCNSSTFDLSNSSFTSSDQSRGTKLVVHSGDSIQTSAASLKSLLASCLATQTAMNSPNATSRASWPQKPGRPGPASEILICHQRSNSFAVTTSFPSGRSQPFHDLRLGETTSRNILELNACRTPQSPHK